MKSAKVKNLIALVLYLMVFGLISIELFCLPKRGQNDYRIANSFLDLIWPPQKTSNAKSGSTRRKLWFIGGQLFLLTRKEQINFLDYDAPALLSKLELHGLATNEEIRDCLTDEWDTPIALSINYDASVTITSCGQNRRCDNGKGDDLEFVLKTEAGRIRCYFTCLVAKGRQSWEMFSDWKEYSDPLDAIQNER